MASAKKSLVGIVSLVISFFLLAKTAVLPYSAIEYFGGYWHYDSVLHDISMFGGFALLALGVIVLKDIFTSSS